MVVVMQEGAKEEQIQHVIDRLVSMGFDIHRSTGASQTVLGAVGVPPDFDPRDIEVLDGVREVVRITQPYKLASRAFRPRERSSSCRAACASAAPKLSLPRGLARWNRRADRRDRRSRREGGRENSARRRVQAAQLAVQFSGARRKSASS